MLTADHYVGGATAPTLRAILDGLRAALTSGRVDQVAVETRPERQAAAYAARDAQRVAAEAKALASAGGPVDPAAVAVAATETPALFNDAIARFLKDIASA